MTVAAGTRLGMYEMLSPLGAGGMGEVWRARDTRLGREVALKMLPEAFASDPDRLARFEREAKVLASLNHPNIAHLYGLETASPCHPERSDLRGRGVEGSPEAQSDAPENAAFQFSGDPSTRSSDSLSPNDIPWQVLCSAGVPPAPYASTPTRRGRFKRAPFLESPSFVIPWVGAASRRGDAQGNSLVITPDGEGDLRSYRRLLSTLYAFEGL